MTREKMIQAMQRYFASVSPIFLDGCIAVLLAVLMFMLTVFAQDDAEKHIGSKARWWIVLILGTSAQGLHALSKFRDQTFSRHVNKLEVAADEQKQIDKEDRADRKALTKLDTGP